MVFLDHPVHLSLACLCNMCWSPSVLLKSDFQFQEKVTGRQIMHVKSKDCVDVGEKLESNSISLRHLAPMQDQTHSMSWCTTSWMSKKKKWWACFLFPTSSDLLPSNYWITAGNPDPITSDGRVKLLFGHRASLRSTVKSQDVHVMW